MLLRLKLLTVFIILTICLCATADGEVLNSDVKQHEIDRLLEKAINHGLISGGVVLIGNSRKDLFCRGMEDCPQPRRQDR
jgi:hypothetical protein